MEGATTATYATYTTYLGHPRPFGFTSILEEGNANPDDLLEHPPMAPPGDFTLTTADIV